MARTVTKVLVVNYRGEMRILASMPRLAMDEVGFTLNVRIPDRRPPQGGVIDLNLPEFTPPSFDVSATPLAWGFEDLPVEPGRERNGE